MMKLPTAFRGHDVFRPISLAGVIALTATVVVASPATFATEKDWQPITREEVLEIIANALEAIGGLFQKISRHSTIAP